MKKTVRFSACLLAVALCLNLTACCVQHTYSAATCAGPGVCSKCGKVSDDPLPEHTWTAAACAAPKTCSVCGKTEGSALGHKFGEWLPEDADAIGGREIRECSVCGETETKTVPRQKGPSAIVLSESGLHMTCREFAEYLIGYLPDTVYITDVQSDQFTIQGKITFGDGMFLSAETLWVVGYVVDSSAHYKDRIVITTEDQYAVERMLPYLYDAIAPSLSGSARTSAVNAIKNAFSSGSGGIYFGKADLGACMCTMSYIPSVSDYPMLTFATKRFVNG